MIRWVASRFFVEAQPISRRMVRRPEECGSATLSGKPTTECTLKPKQRRRKGKRTTNLKRKHQKKQQKLAIVTVTNNKHNNMANCETDKRESKQDPRNLGGTPIPKPTVDFPSVLSVPHITGLACSKRIPKGLATTIEKPGATPACHSSPSSRFLTC